MSDGPAAWLDAHPEAEALVVGAEHWSYARLAARTSALAAALRARGLAPGDLLAVPTTDPLAVLLLAHAALRAGIVFFPLSPELPLDRREALLRGSGARWWWGMADGLPSGVEAVELPSQLPEVPFAPTPLPPAAPQLLIATSGSSGEPKAVMLSGAGLAAAAAASAERLPLRTGDRWLACLPLHHVGGMAILYRCAAAGAAVLLQTGFDPTAVAAAAATHISLVPAMLARLLDAGLPPPAGLRHALLGGGPLSPGLAERARAAGWPLCASYGLSETGSQLATDCSPTAGALSGAVGRPLEGFEVECPVCNEPPGRLRVRGPALMLGYANPRRIPGDGLVDGWYESADLACRTAAGTLQVLGRADDVLVSGGVNVHPLQVEAVLSTLPGIGEVAVTAVADPVWGERLAALYCGNADAGELEQAARPLLPSAQRPRLWFRVEALPRVGPQKLDRRALRGLAARLAGGRAL